ncbi:hypothetical protein C8P63_101195 [Melghirimyces profundicolus]|uniref:Uncharacterized protein n=2 Tax=Melghirimyces profundicolus TaxID=1242148 RepID=A0A2T6C9L6_9BACL|nr:hypothetical protein C8P63_101195 [Melghirimyces profundicolus]
MSTVLETPMDKGPFMGLCPCQLKGSDTLAFLIWFLIWWFIGLLLIDWKHWRNGYPTALIASLGSFLLDTISIGGRRGFWSYQDPFLDGLWPNIILNLSLYPVGAWIYVQRFPRKKTHQWLWILLGAMILLIIELHLKLFGYMSYHNGWNMLYSALTNVFLLLMLRLHHLKVEQET